MSTKYPIMKNRLRIMQSISANYKPKSKIRMNPYTKYKWTWKMFNRTKIKLNNIIRIFSKIDLGKFKAKELKIKLVEKDIKAN